MDEGEGQATPDARWLPEATWTEEPHWMGAHMRLSFSIHSVRGCMRRSIKTI